MTKIAFFERNYSKILLYKLLSPIWKGVLFTKLSPFSVEDIPDPIIEYENEVLVRNIKTGICGSDISILKTNLDPRVAPAALSMYERIYLGHENVAEILDIGSKVKGLRKGDRVVVAEAKSCKYLEIEPCISCQYGRPFVCKNASNQHYQHVDTGGGFSKLWKYNYKQLIKVPNDLDDDFAVLTEPFGIGMRAIHRRKPRQGDKILIYGFGSIGIIVLLSLKFKFPKTEIYVIARYKYQKDLAQKFGATVIDADWEKIAVITEANMYKIILNNKMLLGGFDQIYDCIGKSLTIQNSLRWSRAGGSVIIVGVNLNLSKLDLSPIWYQEVDLLGSYISGWDSKEDLSEHTYHQVFDLFRSGLFQPSDIITHRFSLDEYKPAIEAFLNKKKSNAIKVIFEFSNCLPPI